MVSSHNETLKKIAEAYDSPTWWYDIRGFFILTFTYRASLWQQVAFFSSNMGNAHLEGAIGTGTLFSIILHWRRLTRKPAVHIIGFDYAEPMLKGARKRFAKFPNVTIMHGDVGALALEENRFDTVNIANAMHCFPDIDLALRELHRVLKPGGKMAINVLIYPKGNSLLDRIAHRINNWGIQKGILVTPYQRDDIRRRIVAAGFDISEESYHGNVLDIVAIKR